MTPFDVTFASVGRMPLPGAQVYWMSAWDEWFDATFWMVAARRGSDVVLINTGPPHDLTALNTLWKGSHPSGRCQYERADEEQTLAALSAMGIDPLEVTHIVLTPMVAYTSGALKLFPNAKIVISRRGWIEDVLAPPIPQHLTRQVFVPDELLSWLLFEAQDRLVLIDGEQLLLPGFTVWESGVHHRSSMVADITTEFGELAVTDSAFAYGNVEKNISLGVGESYAEAMHAYARIRSTTDALLPLYDPEAAARFPNGKVSW